MYIHVYACGYSYPRGISPKQKGSSHMQSTFRTSPMRMLDTLQDSFPKFLRSKLKSGPSAPCQYVHHSKSCAKSIGSGPWLRPEWTDMETPDVFQCKIH